MNDNDLVTISQEAYEANVTEQDVISQQEERDLLKGEIKLLEYAISTRKQRIAEITATLCLIQLAASHQLCRRNNEIQTYR